MNRGVDLQVGGLTPLTTLDFPGRIACVVFCQGCPLRCPYCHNEHLISRSGGNSWSSVRPFLLRRRGLLDGVVFSGGEPILQRGLLDAISEVKEMGFAIGLHTSGIFPARFADILPHLDWVGMDVKAPFDQYARVGGSASVGQNVRESLRMLLDSGVDYEIRTTVNSNVVGRGELLFLAQQLADLGVQRYVLVHCRTVHCLDNSVTFCKNTDMPSDEHLDKMKKLFPNFSIRAD